ncbi:unnamed protein product, partial [Staurois parvus]
MPGMDNIGEHAGDGHIGRTCRGWTHRITCRGWTHRITCRGWTHRRT